MSTCLTQILPEADKNGIEPTPEDLRPLIDIFHQQKAFKNLPQAKILEFVTMLLAQFNITKDIGVPLGVPLSNIAEAVQRKELGRADGERQIKDILALVKTRIEALNTTQEVRALLLRWLEFNKAGLPPMSLDPNEIKREMDDLARSWASKVTSGEYFGDQESSPDINEWFDSFDIEKRISPNARRADMQFFTMAYEVMQWAREQEIPFTLKDTVRLAHEFEKILDMKTPGMTHDLYLGWAQSAFWRGKMIQEVGLALPPFQGIERQVIMSIANGSATPLNKVLEKVTNVDKFIEGKKLGEDTIRDLRSFATQCIQFSSNAFSQYRNPTTFARTCFEHISLITKGYLSRPQGKTLNKDSLEQEVVGNVAERFGALFIHHRSSLSAILVKEGGTAIPDEGSAEDIARNCFQLFAQKNDLFKNLTKQ